MNAKQRRQGPIDTAAAIKAPLMKLKYQSEQQKQQQNTWHRTSTAARPNTERCTTWAEWVGPTPLQANRAGFKPL
jgi:hypothetical protein